MNQIILECKKIKFFSKSDKKAFFDWIDNAIYIETSKGVKDKIVLYIVNKSLETAELLDLVALFRRYKINMKQLEQFFINDDEKFKRLKKQFSYCVWPAE